MKSKILKFELIGTFFIIFLGSLLHFTFEWSAKFWLVGIFSAVNESTWEHLKLAVIPALLWMLIETKILKEKPKSFFFAKTKGIYSMLFLLFYFFILIRQFWGKIF
jgi:ABC-type cobalamin transport system permease subunit